MSILQTILNKVSDQVSEDWFRGQLIEELGDTKFAPETSTEIKSDPYNVLENVMKDKGVTFDQIKSKLIKEGYEDAENLKSVSDLPKFKMFELVERLKKVEKKS